MTQSRREFLGASAPVLAMASVPAGAEEAQTLRNLADHVGLEVGSIHRRPMPPLEADLLRRHCHVVTPENGMKTSWTYLDRQMTPDWQVTAACNDHDCFAAGDAARDFAQDRGLALHGHAVYWPKHGLPPADGQSTDGVSDAWSAHIAHLVERYPEVVSWDVLNEVLAQDWSRLRQNGWRALNTDPQLGSDPDVLLDHYAFCIRSLRDRLAERGRSVRLLLNEADLNGGKDGHAIKRQAVIDLVDALADRGATLDGVGLQCHFKASSPPDEAKVAEFIRALAGRGMVAHVSELDFLDDRPRRCSPEELELQADIVGPFLTTVLAEPNVRRLAFWGLSDPHHPFQRLEKTRKAGLSPAVFRNNGNGKPVFSAIAAAIAAAPPRDR